MILALLIFNIAFWLYYRDPRSAGEPGHDGRRKRKRSTASEGERERERARARGREQGRSGGRACLLRASGVWMRAQLDREAYKTDGDLKLLSNERLWVVF
jgi:hypothetical protein